MLAICPLILESIRRGGVKPAIAGSLVLFGIGRWNPWLLNLPLSQHFFPALWQLVFIAGIVAGSFLRDYDRLSRPRRIALLIGAAMTTIGLTLLSRLEALGLAPAWAPVFSKVPLSLPEAGRYVALTLTLILGTDALWRWIAPARLTRAINGLGRQSLALAVAHVWIVNWVLWLGCWLPVSLMTTTGLAGLTLMALWLGGRMFQRAGDAWAGRMPHAPRLGYVAVPMLGGAVVLALIAFNPAAHMPDHRVKPMQLARVIKTRR
jgi:hypothetical protein